MGVIGLVLKLIGVMLLLLGIAFVWVLWQIVGKTDGPGAILFHIGAFGGIAGGWIVLSSLRPSERQ